MTGEDFLEEVYELLAKEDNPPLDDEDVVMRIEKLTRDELIEIIKEISI
jgi:hypothetical protein